VKASSHSQQRSGSSGQPARAHGQAQRQTSQRRGELVRFALLVATTLVPASVETFAADAHVPPSAAILAVKPLEQLAPKLDRFLEAVRADHVRLVLQLIDQQATRGVDRRRPAGAVMVGTGDGFQLVWLVPAADPQRIRANLAELLGSPKREGTIDRFPGTKPWFVGTRGDWVVITRRADLAERIPGEWLQSVTRLAGRHDVALMVRPETVSRQVPESVEQHARQSQEAVVQALFGRSELARLATGTALTIVAATFAELLAGASSATLGIDIDDHAGALEFELSMARAAGAPAAAWFAALDGNSSPLGRLTLPEAAARFQLAWPLPEPLQSRWIDSLRRGRSRLRDVGAVDSRAQATARAEWGLRVPDAAFRLAEAAVRRGRVDFQLAWAVAPGRSLVVMAGVAETQVAVRDAFEQIVTGIQSDGRVENVRRTSRRLPDGELIRLTYASAGRAELERLFGTEQTMVLARTAEVFFIGYGHEADKWVSEWVSQAPARPVPAKPLEASLSLGALASAYMPVPRPGTVPHEASEKRPRTPDQSGLLTVETRPTDHGATTRVVIQRIPLGQLVDTLFRGLGKANKTRSGSK